MANVMQAEEQVPEKIFIILVQVALQLFLSVITCMSSKHVQA
jgi:hypothetical protein